MHQNKSIAHYFLADRSIGVLQNSFALAGDYLSAAAFLGSIAMYFSQGMDSLFYAVATLLGWVLLLLFFSDKLRGTGAFTFSDVINRPFNSDRLKILSAITSLLISIFYLLVQLVGASALLSLLLNLTFITALSIISLLTLFIVLIGGMRATTFIQSIKALLLFLFAFTLAYLVLERVNFSFEELFLRAAAIASFDYLMPSKAISSGIEQVSLILGLLLGLLGLPHILMRFFTVKNQSVALFSAAGTTLLIALFFILNLLIGFGAVVLLEGQQLTGGANMTLLHLASLLGGTIFQTILALLVLITVLAVISGIVMAASATVTHDLLPLLKKDQKWNNAWQLIIARFSVLIIFVLGATLAYFFREMNLAFLFGLAFSWVASAHFPVMLGRFYLKGYSEKGAFYALLVGTFGTLLFLILSDTVWVDIFAFNSLYPYRSPTLFILPLTLMTLWLLRTREVGKREAVS
ncbi:sodium:solute symporter family transporter [Ignatzschineria cameli]|uniref:Cation acetate symporter n=1 Tax=Ignatzschineria cameli TaxID=2182793 RepID=A0A2U2AU60_9GAMM|nr:hypothetical protein [Ignatzschineria cameli]PWD87251.1 hypothetical protein DC080_00010 [Ignatzschineria cameli]PWD88259.1 hypothetical protein DC077_03055 [Ignatzschineria cameli]